MMATTLRVSESTRDLLKAQARARGLTLGDYLTELATEAERRDRFDALRDAIASMSPDDRTSYQAETEAWERTELVDARGRS